MNIKQERLTKVLKILQSLEGEEVLSPFDSILLDNLSSIIRFLSIDDYQGIEFYAEELLTLLDISKETSEL